MRGHGGKHQCQSGGRKERETAKNTAVIGVSAERAWQSRVNSLGLACLNNSNGPWGIGVVRSCPVPALALFMAEKILAWCVRVRRGGH